MAESWTSADHTCLYKYPLFSKQGRELSRLTFLLAETVGIEPTFLVSKANVLPLH